MIRTLLPAAFVLLQQTVGSIASEACDAPGITLSGGDLATRERVCRAAGRAVHLLAACNLHLDEETTIQIVTTLPESCLGLYDCAVRRLEVLAPDAFRDARLDTGPFASLEEAEYYDSIVVHELAHAAYDDEGCPFDECVVTAEYLAYAMQISSLSPAGRSRFEAASSVVAAEARSYLGDGMLMMSPERFAMAAWAHFSSHPDPCAYVARILSGEETLDTGRPMQ